MAHWGSISERGRVGNGGNAGDGVERKQRGEETTTKNRGRSKRKRRRARFEVFAWDT
jgi:hypothetical protein